MDPGIGMAAFCSMLALKAILTSPDSKRERFIVQYNKAQCAQRLNIPSVTVSVFTFIVVYFVIECADILPQIFNSYEGVLFYLVHFLGGTAAATLTIESTIAVPFVAGQRSLPLDWKRMRGRWGRKRTGTQECEGQSSK